MRLKPPHRADAPARFYAMLGRLPDGLARGDADLLLPGDGNAAATCLVRIRLARLEADRLRMLVPVREHAARGDLAPEDALALREHYLGLAGELRRYFTGDYRGVDLPRLRAELVNIEAVIGQSAQAATGDDEAGPFRRELGSLSVAVGDARRQLGQLALALAAYHRAQEIYSALVASDPDDARWQNDLAVSWSRLGDVRRAQGDLEGALQAYTAGKGIRERLAATDPGNATWQRDLIVSHWKLANLLEEMADRQAEAAAHWSQALAIARRLADEGRLAPADGYLVEALERRLAASGAR
jgi:tetratricopeptide (TPR) repeat protein